MIFVVRRCEIGNTYGNKAVLYQLVDSLQVTEISKQGGLMLMLMMMMMMMMSVLCIHQLVRFVENKYQCNYIFQDIQRISSDEMTSDTKSDNTSSNYR